MSCPGIQVRRRLCRSYTVNTQSLRLTRRMRRTLEKDCPHSFFDSFKWPRLAAAEMNRTHNCLVDPTLCTQRYFTERQELKAKTGNIKSVFDLFDSLAVCDEPQVEVRKLADLLHVPIITQSPATRSISPEDAPPIAP